MDISTIQFLELLDDRANEFRFTTMPAPLAKASGLGIREHVGSLDDHVSTLQKSNDRGCGVFFLENSSYGKGRKAENIARVRPVWPEDDDGWQEQGVLNLLPFQSKC